MDSFPSHDITRFNLTTTRKLALLSLATVSVGVNGEIVSRIDTRSDEICQYFSSGSGINRFTDDDDAVLLCWDQLAVEQGLDVGRYARFDHLASINIRHGSDTWRKRWDLLKKSRQPSSHTIPRSPNSTGSIPAEQDPNDRGVANDNTSLMQQRADCRNRQVPGPIARTERDPTEQCDYGKVFDDDLSELDDYQSGRKGNWTMYTRAGVMRSLPLRTTRELAAFVAESWFLKTYLEYAEGYLNPVTRHDQERGGPEKMGWTSTAAKTTLRMAKSIISKKSKTFFQDATPDTRTWDSNQHRLRFMMRFLLLSQDHAIWTEKDTMGVRCVTAYKISCWLEWTHHPQYAETRVEQMGQEWFTFLRHSVLLASIRGDLVLPPPEASPARGNSHLPALESSADGIISPRITTADTSTAQSVEGEGDGDGESHGEGSRGSEDDDSIDSLPSLGGPPTESAELAFISHQRNLLGRWGVLPEHRSSCVLVPREFSQVDDPAVLLKDFQTNGLQDFHQYLDIRFRTRVEPRRRRLACRFAGKEAAYVRAGVWFNAHNWPNGKDASDWAEFSRLDKTTSKLQASHLCHHALCICPSHVICESQSSNLSRASCAESAQTFRQYGLPTPEHCISHSPPCLLQLAALTTEETLSIQLDVLSQARGLPRGLIKPTGINHGFSTFEGSLPFSSSFANSSSHKISDADLVRNHKPCIHPGPVKATCKLCPVTRSFSRIEQLWLHYRLHHAPKNREEESQIMDEIYRSASQYVALWREKKREQCVRSFTTPKKYATQFPGGVIVSQRLESLQHKAVDWETFGTWRIQTWGRAGVPAQHMTSSEPH